MNWLFGDEWKGSPAADDMPFIPTPVGEKCFFCEEPILDGESGIKEMYLEELLTPTTGTGRWIVHHYECHLRRIVGSLLHQQKKCTCYGGSNETDETMTKREEARAALASYQMNMRQRQNYPTH